ncbi:uncharacterized protein LY79DRAFT_368442 [Colletotrichum navitas]|uniref:Uncharacterized protein n=1 Tax=Colletotrichum navitas TaxID=681940 RepID=A0AAD8PQJ3_9PEZI|nr:uncharacterized protein LY79DRAFT_368442 [Colletotrichum navitas]KAK1574411.1 hypothetical protein LY79DRAFT_368442 [Colletotrichum navitas]
MHRSIASLSCSANAEFASSALIPDAAASYTRAAYKQIRCPITKAFHSFCRGYETRTEARYWFLAGYQLTFRPLCPLPACNVPDIRLVGHTGPAATCCRWPPRNPPPESLFDVREPRDPRGLPGPRASGRSQRPQYRDPRRRYKAGVQRRIGQE